MLVRHHLFISAALNGAVESLRCKIESNRVIGKDEINRVVSKLTERPTTMEDLAVLLAGRFGATVTLSGRNSDGIETDITAP